MISLQRIARLPPVIFFAALLAGAGAQSAHPVFLGLDSLPIALSLGGVFLLSAIAFAWSALREMKTHGTTEEPESTPTALVTSGAFSLSRNPLYVSLISVLIAISLMMNSLWLLAACCVLWAALHFVVVPQEEKVLAREFPEEFEAYRKRVRRWL